MNADRARGGVAGRVPVRARPALGAYALVVLVAQLTAARPAGAGLFDDEEARKRIDETNGRIVELQRRVDERMASLETQLKSQGLLELFGAVELLKADIARLRGQIEVLTHELGEAQKRQRDLYVDLDSRMRRMEVAQAQLQSQVQAQALQPAPGGAVGTTGATTAVPGATASAGAAAPGSAGAGAATPGNAGPGVAATGVAAPGIAASGLAATGAGASGSPSPSGNASAGVSAPAGTGSAVADLAAEQRTYDAALEQFKRADYPGAISAFGAFVKTHPRSPLAPSAQYWIGNAQFARKDFRAAIASQRSLIQQYPDSAKVPDAMLNIASAQAELNDNAAARRTLEELIARHPASEASTKARQRLGVR